MSVEAGERRVRGRAYLIANGVLLLAIAFMLNYLAFRHYERWDWTEESIYTLSERTVRVLEGIDRPVTIYVLLSRNEPEQNEVRTLLERYRAVTSRITVRYVDPLNDPGGYDRLVERYELPLTADEMSQQEGIIPLVDVAVLVVSGDRHWEIGRNDLVHRTFEETGEVLELDVEAERAITGAIVAVLDPEPTHFCFATGHGELPTDSALAAFAEELRRENVDPETVDLNQVSAIPEHCDALAIMGPELRFDGDAVSKIRAYLRAGGNALIALDPHPAEEHGRVAETGLEDMLGDYGVRLGRDVVVEPDRAYLPASQGHPILLFLATDFGEHELTERLRAQHPDLRRVAISEARSVTPIDDRAQILLRASESSYAETDLTSELGEPGADDLRGPISIAVATRIEQTGAEGEEEASGGRLVVLGDATLLTSELLVLANTDFGSAIIGWLTERRALIAIAPRSVERPGVPSQDSLFWLGVKVLLLIPLAFVFLGVAVWMNRRS